MLRTGKKKAVRADGRWRLSALLCALLMAWASPAVAQDDEDPAAAWQGTGVTLRTQATALTLAPSAEPNYNPTVGMSADLLLAWRFADAFSFRVAAGVDREITRSDFTTEDGELFWRDTFVTLGVGPLVTIPGAEIAVSGNLGLQLPTGKISQARTMIIGISPGLGFSRAFGLLEGLSLSYNVSGGLFMHEATTSQRETPLISDCVNSSTGCESFLNMGVRNHRWRIINGFGLSLGIVPRLSVNLGTTVFTDFLYDSVEDERVSFTPQEVNNVRYAIIYSASVAWRPTDLVTLRLGSLSIGAQQKPDSTLRTPFFNRNTVLFFDLGFNLAGLMGGLSSGS